MTTRLTRRHFLRGAGGIVIGLPFLEAMLPGNGLARGADLPRPQRFVALLAPNGTVRDQWFPVGTETEFTLGEILSPLQDHIADLVVLKGIDNPVAETGEVDGHKEGVVSFLTGFGATPGGGSRLVGVAGGISLDQELARRIGGNTRKASLELGTENTGTISTIAYSEFRQPLPKYVHPKELFAALFGDPSLDPGALSRLVERRKSILDSVGADYRALLPRVSGEDRQRLEAHAESIRQIETRLAVQSACVPPVTSFPDVYAPEDLPAWTRDTLDLLVLALSCDLTRVATLVYRHPGGGTSYFPWLGLGENDGVPEHHQMTHELTTWVPELVNVFRWYVAQTAYLVQRLKETPDLGGTLLDSTLVLHGSECSDGSVHDKKDIPLLLLGQAGGRLRTGRFVTYDGRPQNDLLVSILNLFGVEATTFGNSRFCNGPLPGLVG